MKKQVLALLIFIPLVISLFTQIVPIQEHNISNDDEKSNIFTLPTGQLIDPRPFKEELIKTNSYSLPGISPFITFKLYKSQVGQSVHIDGNGKGIYIGNDLSFQLLKSKIMDLSDTLSSTDSLVIENAPGTILENFNFDTNFSLKPASVNKLSTVFLEENKTSSSTFTLTNDHFSVIRNVTYTSFLAASTSIIRVQGSENVTIYNNTFTGITVNNNLTVIGLTNINGYASSGTQIFDNTFTSITAGSSATLISLEGSASLPIKDIYVANNNITNVKTNYGQLTAINLAYGNNVTIFNNSISNIDTNGSYSGILSANSNLLNITNNNLNLIYSLFEIQGFGAQSTTGITFFNNSMIILASKNDNVTGVLLESCSGFNFINNTISQLIASYDSFDFSDSKIVKGLVVNTSATSVITGNSFNQLSSKSKAFAMILSDIPSGKVNNNSITGINSKSSSAIVVQGSSNTNSEVSFNIIQNIVSTATDTIGITITNANSIKAQNNTLYDLESFSNLIGIAISNSPSASVLNNSLNLLSTNSPVYNLYGIRLSYSNNSVVTGNLINKLYSQLTFVGAIAIENSWTITINYNNITNSRSDFSSTFGILLDSDRLVSLANNYIFNLSTTNAPAANSFFNKISKTSLTITSTGGFGVFVYLSNNITLNSNSISSTTYWLNADETVTFITFSNNIVDGTPLTFVSMTHPADKTFEQGSQVTNITWVANDPSASLYSIYVDSALVSNGLWSNNVPIVFGVSDINTLSLGHHEVQLVLTDDKGHKINDIVTVDVVEFTPPTFIASLTNISILNGSLGNSLSWTAYDLNPSTYYVYRNGTLITSATWTSNFPISQNIDGLNIGTYNFTIVVEDSSQNKVIGSRFVYVLTNGTILFNLKPSSAILSNYGSKNTTLSWIISSVQGGQYIVDVDGAKYSGVWSPNTPITFTLQNLALGEHNITFTASNAFTNVSQNIIVNVIIPQTATTNTTTIIPSLTHTSAGSNFLNIIRIDTNSLMFLILFIVLIGGTGGFLYYNRYKQYQSRNYINKSERIEQLIEVGKAYIKMGNNLKAISVFKKALRGATVIDDVRLKAQILVNLGYVGLQLKDDSSIDSALTYLTEALELSQTIKDKTIQVLCYSYLGDLYSLKGDSGEAIKHYNTGIKLANELDDEALGIQILEKLGLYYHHLGQYPNAIRSFDQGLTLATTIKDLKAEMNFNFYKGNSLLQQNQNSDAISFYNKSLKIANRLNDVTNQAKVTGEIGRAYYQMEKSESKAIKAYNDSIELAKQVGDERIEAYQNRNLAILLFEQSKFDEALEKIDMSLTFEKNPQFLNIKADTLIGQKEIPMAIKFYKKALASARKNDELGLESIVLQKLVMIETKLMHEAQAVKYKTELDQVLPNIEEWDQKLSSKISRLKILKSTKVEEIVYTLIGENVEPDPKEIEKIRREAERLEKINLKEASREEADKENTGGKKNE